MKTCPKCNTPKELSEFYTKGNKKNGSSYCRKCFNSYCVDRWIQKKKDAVDYKGGKCSKCGYNEHYAALQFHHLNPSEKEYSWNKLRLMSWDKIKKELDKCIILCANCHSIQHSGTS